MKKFLLMAAVLCTLAAQNIFSGEVHSYNYLNPVRTDRNKWQRSGFWSYVPLGKNECLLVDFDFHGFEKSPDKDKEDFYIPSSIKNLKVTELDAYMLSWSPMEGSLPYSVKRIHIPETVTFIAQNAFSGMEDGTRKTQFVLDGNNPAYEITDCGRHSGGLYSKKDNALITAFYIFSGDSSESAYGNYDEDGYDESQYFKPREGTKVICEGAFGFNSSYRMIDLPEGITAVENCFDEEYIAPESFHIPSSVQKLGMKCFPKNFVIDENNPYLEVSGGCVYDKKAKSLLAVCDNSLEEIDVKAGTMRICSIPCNYNRNIKKLNIPDSVKVIEKLHGITDFNIPANLVRLETFVPENVMLPDSCQFSKSGTVGKNNPYLKSEKHMLFSKDGRTVYAIYSVPEDGKLIIPEGVENIDRSVRDDNFLNQFESISEIVFPESVKKIPVEFLCLRKEGSKINIPAGAKVVTHPAEEKWEFNWDEDNQRVQISVDEKNPEFAVKNGFFYNKKNGQAYFLRLKPDCTFAAIPPEFSDLSYFGFSNAKKPETVVITNPNTVFGSFIYNCDGSENFRLYVPKKSRAENNLAANHIIYRTYVPYVTTDNLRLRSKAGTEDGSAVITTLGKGSVVMITKKGGEDVIDGISGNWVKVTVLPPSCDRDGKPYDFQTELSGWCFNGYLSEKK